MKFWTIWTLPLATFGEKIGRTRDWAALKIAARLPIRVRYWVSLLEIGKATMDSPNVPATTVEEVLRNLEKPKSLA